MNTWMKFLFCAAAFFPAVSTRGAAAGQHAEEAAKEWRLLERDIAHPLNATRQAQAFNAAATILPGDRDPLDVLVRRTRALCNDLKAKTDLSKEDAELAKDEAAAAQTDRNDPDARLALFLRVHALRRRIALANPLLRAVPELVFVTREALPPDEYTWGVHMCDQFYGFHATAKNSMVNPGIYVLEKPWSDAPVLKNLVEGRKIEAGAWKGRTLGYGGYLSPDVSYDGKTVLFAYTAGEPSVRVWNDNTTFHIFRCNADGSGLVQLTDGSVNDFDPCWLPNGRICFISERRGGFGRCHRREVPTFTLFSMFDDGTDIVRLSSHETNEWAPSIDNNGMIVYTRWDYVDRGFNQAHHPWITYPDGRDPRELQGNTRVSQGVGGHLIRDIRAIPGSKKYVATAAGHHTELRGSLIVIDASVPDDGGMAQIRRLTPEQLLPESEYYGSWSVSQGACKGSGSYGTPWPLSENYYLCVYDGDANGFYPVDCHHRKYAITLLDAFGNKIKIFEHPFISCLDAMPLAPRMKPPVLAHQTLVGKPRNPDGSKPPVPTALPKTAVIGCVNVYNGRLPLPKGVKVTALRIWEVLPKFTPIVGSPRLGAVDQTPGRQCLGTVPVEADGSAYFEAPVNVSLFFQALDADGLTVQGMRSATYVAPGESLMCNGCHESRTGAMRQTQAVSPLAMRRKPSVIQPEVEGSKPFNYPRLVQGVLDAKCVKCHGENRKPDMPDLRKGDIAKNPFHFHTSFIELVPYLQYYSSAYLGKEWYKVGVQRDAFVKSYTAPMEYGAHGSKLWGQLQKGHHGVKLTDDERRRLIVFLDSHAAYFAHDFNTEAQAEGKIVPPALE